MINEEKRLRNIERGRLWRQKNAEYHRQQSREYGKRRRVEDPAWKSKWAEHGKKRAKRLRLETLVAYGGLSCSCNHGGQPCGPKPIEFLAIDHTTRELKKKYPNTGTPFYVRLKREGFPPGFRVLCHNCNLALGFYGKCPLAVDAKSLFVV